jgi:hypothetical protein
MNTQVYIGALVFLFILLLLGWSKNLFWFLAGGVVGIVGLKMYESEMLERLSRPTDIIDELNVKGVWSPHKTILIERMADGCEKQLIIQNNPIPREKITEVTTKVHRPFCTSLNPDGIKLELVLCPKIKSNKGMLYGPGDKPLDYYLELHPTYTKRDEYGHISGYYALRKNISDTRAEELEDPQKTEKHSKLLDYLAVLLRSIWDGDLPEEVALLGASRQYSSMPDVGVLSMFSNVGNVVSSPAQIYQMQDRDMIHSEGEQRGIASVRYDDEILKLPVIGKKPPDASKVENMPFLRKINEMAEDKKLLLVMQDYVTSGLTDGKQLPKNVIYICQSVRLIDQNKVVLNAFINPICYDYVLRALQKVLT